MVFRTRKRPRGSLFYPSVVPAFGVTYGALPSRGLTIVELVVTLAIFSIVMAIGAPALMGVLERSQPYNLAHALKEAMAKARTEAIKRNHRVTVCPSLDATTCSGSSWEKGWIVFADTNNNATRDDGEELIFAQSDRFSGAVATGNSPVKSYVSYSADGRPQTQSGAIQMGTFTVCGKSLDALKVVLSSGGLARVDKATKDEAAEKCGAKPV